MSIKNELPTLLSIPSPYSQELVDKLLPFSVVKTYPSRRKLIISSHSTQFCYLVARGVFELYREKDDLVIAFWTTPVIIGLNNLTNMNLGIYIKTVTTCEIGRMRSDEALKHIEELSLWKVLALHLLHVSAKLFTVGQQLSAPRMYEIIRSQLLEYLSEDQKIRDTITVERYIRLKTSLSRSGIMKVLLSLKKGGHIEMVRGKLLKINSLPKKY